MLRFDRDGRRPEDVGMAGGDRHPRVLGLCARMKAAGLSWIDVVAIASVVISVVPLLIQGLWALVKMFN